MMCFKGEQELLEDFLLSLLFGNDEWMMLSMEIVSKIVDINDTFAIFVELIEGLDNQIFSALLHLASDSKNELVKGDWAISVCIKVFEQELCSFIVKIAADENHCLSELLKIQGLTFVHIHVVEKADEFDISFCTSSPDRFSHFGLQLKNWISFPTALETIRVSEFDILGPCGTLFLVILDVFLKVKIINEIINIDLFNLLSVSVIIECVNRVKILQSS